MKDRIITSASVKGTAITLVEYNEFYSTYFKVFLNKQEFSKHNNSEAAFEDFSKLFDSLTSPPN